MIIRIFFYLSREDSQLLKKSRPRDFNYSKFKQTSTHKDHLLCTNSRGEFQSLNRLKMKEYFAQRILVSLKIIIFTGNFIRLLSK